MNYLSLNTNILTENGFKNIKELKTGDLVFNEFMKVSKITKIDLCKKDCFSIKTTANVVIDASKDSEILTRNRYDVKIKRPHLYRDLSSISRSTFKGRQFNFGVKTSGLLEFPESDIKIDPYILGALLGDGCWSTSASVSFTTVDYEIVEYFKKYLPPYCVIKHRKGFDYRIVRNDDRRGQIKNLFKEYIGELNLLGTKSDTKFIPDVYKYTSKSNRIEILRGLFDTDGWIGYQTNKKENNRIQYYTTSEKLKDDVSFIVRSLGGNVKSHIREFEEKDDHIYNGHKIRHTKSSYTLEISMPDNLNPFKLKRKSDKFLKQTMVPISICDVSEIGQIDTIGIELNEGRSIIVENFIIV